jgi:hypothetical protein
MKCLILAVFLVIAQAVPPASRKAPDNPTSAAESSKKQANPDQAPAAPAPIATDVAASPKDKASFQKKQDTDEQKTITISKLPSVSVETGWRDNFGLFLTFILVAVTALQAYLLCRTLQFVKVQSVITRRQTRHIARQARSMRYQTTHLKNSVDAARANVDIVINKERARIRVEPGPLEWNSHVGSIYAINYKVFNYGYTRAFIERAQAEITVNKHKNPPEKPEHSWPMGLPQAVEPNIDGLANNAFFIPPTLTAQQIESIREHKLFVHFWGAVQYKDVFYVRGQSLRETRFTYIWVYSDFPTPPGEQKHGFWMKNGTEGQNYYET